MCKIQKTMDSVVPFLIKVGGTLLFTMSEEFPPCLGSKVLLRLIMDVMIGYLIMSCKQALNPLLLQNF